MIDNIIQLVVSSCKEVLFLYLGIATFYIMFIIGRKIIICKIKASAKNKASEQA
jgi:hypothetical protein